MKNVLKYSILTFFALFIIWELGPKPGSIDVPTSLPKVETDLNLLAQQIKMSEEEVSTKPDNEAKIIWASDSLQKTQYSLVYLHGFGASAFEGAPIHEMIAKKFGMNLYLARLEGHGIDQPADSVFHDLDEEKYIQSAFRAIAIGQSLGDSVIVMSCSTGGTFSVIAERVQNRIAAHIMYSPNFDLFDKRSKILTMPFGLQMAKMINKGEIRYSNVPDVIAKQYWYTEQRLEGVVALRNLLDKTMTDFYFKKFDSPVLVQYWYMNDSIQDQTISTQRIREFQKLIKTPSAKSQFIQLPDVGTHIISSSLYNKKWEEVYQNTSEYLQNVIEVESKINSDSLFRYENVLER